MGTPDLGPDRNYYLFVGYFITQYARVEWTLRGSLRHLARMSRTRFDDLIRNPRSGDLITMTKKLAIRRKQSAESKEAVADAFTHLQAIAKLRDRLVHYGGLPLDSQRTIILAKGAKAEKLSHDETTLQNLWNAALDLDLINNIFLYRIHPMGLSIPEAPWNAVRTAPWLYIPLPQAQNRR
jgi:hypothetical protein